MRSLRNNSNSLCALHDSALFIAETVAAVHGAAIVPHDEITGVPVMREGELCVGEMVSEEAD